MSYCIVDTMHIAQSHKWGLNVDFLLVYVQKHILVLSCRGTALRMSSKTSGQRTGQLMAVVLYGLSIGNECSLYNISNIELIKLANDQQQTAV